MKNLNDQNYISNIHKTSSIQDDSIKNINHKRAIIYFPNFGSIRNRKYTIKQISASELCKHDEDKQTAPYVLTQKYYDNYNTNLTMPEYPFKYQLSPYGFKSKTNFQVYRCQLSPNESNNGCCCSCNSDELFEVMKNLYECYKYRDCVNCNCILCCSQFYEDTVDIEMALKEVAMKGFALPEGKTQSECKLINKLRFELGLPPEPESESMREKYTNAANAGLMIPLEGKTAKQKEKILRGLAQIGIPLPEGRSVSEKSLIAKVKNKIKSPITTLSPGEKMQKAKAEGLLTPFQGKPQDQREKILKGLAMQGITLPEGTSTSEKLLLDKVRFELGLPPEPKTKDMRDKYKKAAYLDVLQPLEAKSHSQKLAILQGLRDLDIPLPVGRTPSEKSIISKIKAVPRTPPPSLASKRLMCNLSCGVLAYGEMTPEQKEELLKKRAMRGVALPEGKTSSEKKLINKVRLQLGLPPEPKSMALRNKYYKAADAGKLLPLEGKSKRTKQKILRGYADIGIPFPKGRTPSEIALIDKIRQEVRHPVLSPDKIREEKSAGVEGKTREDRENTLRKAGLSLPKTEARSFSEQELIRKLKDEAKRREIEENKAAAPNLGPPSLPSKERAKLDKVTAKSIKEATGPCDECICPLLTPEAERGLKSAGPLYSVKLAEAISKSKDKVMKVLGTKDGQKEKVIRKSVATGTQPKSRTASETALTNKIRTKPGKPRLPPLSDKERVKLDQKTAKGIKEAKGPCDECICHLLTPESEKDEMAQLLKLQERTKLDRHTATETVETEQKQSPLVKPEIVKVISAKSSKLTALSERLMKEIKKRSTQLGEKKRARLLLSQERIKLDKQTAKKIKEAKGPVNECICPQLTPESEKVISAKSSKIASLSEKLRKEIKKRSTQLKHVKKAHPMSSQERIRLDQRTGKGTKGAEASSTFLAGDTGLEREAYASRLLGHGISPSEKEKILRCLAEAGVSLPEGETPSEKAIVRKIKKEYKKARRPPLPDKDRAEKESEKEEKMKEVVKKTTLPENSTVSQKLLASKVRHKLGLPPEPKTSSIKEKMRKAYAAGLITPLEGKTPAQKEKTLKRLAEAGIPLPQGRTPTEISIIRRIQASNYKKPRPLPSQERTKLEKQTAKKIKEAKGPVDACICPQLTPESEKVISTQSRRLISLSDKVKKRSTQTEEDKRAQLLSSEEKTKKDQAIIGKSSRSPPLSLEVLKEIKKQRSAQLEQEKKARSLSSQERIKLDKQTAKKIKEAKGPVNECICPQLTPESEKVIFDKSRRIPPLPDKVVKEIKKRSKESIRHPFSSQEKTKSDHAMLAKGGILPALPDERVKEIKKKRSAQLEQEKNARQLSSQERIKLDKQTAKKIKEGKGPVNECICPQLTPESEKVISAKTKSLPPLPEKVLKEIKKRSTQLEKERIGRPLSSQEKTKSDHAMPAKSGILPALSAEEIKEIKKKRSAQLEQEKRARPLSSRERIKLDKQTAKKIKEAKGPVNECICPQLTPESEKVISAKTRRLPALPDKVVKEIKKRSSQLEKERKGRSLSSQEKIKLDQRVTEKSSRPPPLSDEEVKEIKKLSTQLEEKQGVRPLSLPERIKLDKQTAKRIKEAKGPVNECICPQLTPESVKVISTKTRRLPSLSDKVVKEFKKRSTQLEEKQKVTPLSSQERTKSDHAMLARSGILPPLPDERIKKIKKKRSAQLEQEKRAHPLSSQERIKLDKQTAKNIKEAKGPVNECICPQLTPESEKVITVKSRRLPPLPDNVIKEIKKHSTQLEEKQKGTKESKDRLAAVSDMRLKLKSSTAIEGISAERRRKKHKDQLKSESENIDAGESTQKREIFTPLAGKTQSQKVKIINGLAKAGLPLPEGRTRSEKELIKKARQEHGSTVGLTPVCSQTCEIWDKIAMDDARKFQSETNMKTTCDRACGCNKKKIKFKHSYVKIKVTSPDTSSITCPCPNDCFPHLKPGVFKDEQGVSVVIGRVTLPDYPYLVDSKSMEQISNNVISYESTETTDTIASNRPEGNSLIYVLYRANNLESTDSFLNFMNLGNCNQSKSKSLFIDSHSEPNKITPNVYKSSDILKEISVDHMTSSDSDSSFASMLEKENDTSLSFSNSSESLSDDADLTSNCASFLCTSSDIDFSNGSIEEPEIKTSEVNHLTVDSVEWKNPKSCYASTTSTKQYSKENILLNCSKLQDELQTVILTKTDNMLKPEAITNQRSVSNESVIIVNELNSDFDIKILVNELLANKELSGVTSLFVIVASSDEEDDNIINRTSSLDYTRCIQLYETHRKLESLECKELFNSSRRIARNTSQGLKVSAKGKKFFLEGLPLPRLPSNHENISDDVACTYKNQSFNEPEKEISSCYVVSTDTTQDRPCCCLDDTQSPMLRSDSPCDVQDNFISPNPSDQGLTKDAFSLPRGSKLQPVITLTASTEDPPFKGRKESQAVQPNTEPKSKHSKLLKLFSGKQQPVASPAPRTSGILKCSSCLQPKKTVKICPCAPPPPGETEGASKEQEQTPPSELPKSRSFGTQEDIVIKTPCCKECPKCAKKGRQCLMSSGFGDSDVSSPAEICEDCGCKKKKKKKKGKKGKKGEIKDGEKAEGKRKKRKKGKKDKKVKIGKTGEIEDKLKDKTEIEQKDTEGAAVRSPEQAGLEGASGQTEPESGSWTSPEDLSDSDFELLNQYEAIRKRIKALKNSERTQLTSGFKLRKKKAPPPPPPPPPGPEWTFEDAVRLYAQMHPEFIRELISDDDDEDDDDEDDDEEDDEEVVEGEKERADTDVVGDTGTAIQTTEEDPKGLKLSVEGKGSGSKGLAGVCCFDKCLKK